MARQKIRRLGLDTFGIMTIAYQSLGMGLATMVLWFKILPLLAS